MVDEGVETESPSAAESARAFALLGFTVVLWPLSLVPLLLGLGPRRTWILLTNLGYTPTHPWDDARVRGPHYATGWWPLRVGFLCMHHGTVLLFIAAVTLWAASPKPPAPTDVDAWPAPSVTSAMLAFQLLSTLASMLARRLSFATYVFGMMHMSARPTHSMRQLTRGPVSPVRTFKLMDDLVLLTMAARVAPIWLSSMARMRLQIDMPVLRVTASAYRMLYRAANANGDSMTMVPLSDTETAPREVRLPNDHLALSVTPPARFRSDFLRVLSMGSVTSRETNAESGNDAVEHDVQLDFNGWTDVMTLLGDGTADGVLFPMAISLILVGLCVSVAPIAVRCGMLTAGYAFGSNIMEHASAALLMLCEMTITLAPAANGAMLAFGGYCATRTQLQQLARLLQPRQHVPRKSHNAMQLTPPNVHALTLSNSSPPVSATTVTIHWIPMDASTLTPLSAPALRNAARAPLTTIALSVADREHLQGAWVLDTVEATRTCTNALRVTVGGVSTTGLGHTIINAGSASAVMSVLLSGALSVAFSASPDLIASGGLGGTSNVTVLRHAAIVPTLCMLLSFLANCAVLLAAFREASLLLSQIRVIETSVLQAMTAAAAVMSSRAGQKRHLQHAVANAIGCDDAVASSARHHELADVDGDLSELIALADAHCALLTLVHGLLRDSGGVRFLGIFRPGTASVGGLLAVMTSATVLALRLLSAARGGGSFVA